MKKILFLAALLLSTPVHAQTKATPAPLSAINLLANLAPDIDAAIALSTSIPVLQDPVGNACWQSFNGLAQVIKAHPIPLTLKIATDMEAARLVHLALNQICANPNCGQMWLDLQNAQTALAIAPLPFTFSSLCAKVVVIGQVPVAAAPSK